MDEEIEKELERIRNLSFDEMGYIMIQIEQYGFDEEVELIVQPYK